MHHWCTDNTINNQVDVDQCTETAAAHNITAMPTFLLVRHRAEVERLTGADTTALEAKVKELYEAEGWDGSNLTGVKGMIELNTFVSKQGTECLNEADEHPYTNCLVAGPEVLQSDCDEQIILAIAFNQPVKVHSLKFRGPADSGPKTVRVFHNLPNTLDFDRADGMASTQVSRPAHIFFPHHT
jgi:hypothetical protein